MTDQANSELREKYDALITSKGRRFVRDAARELGTTEVQLTAALPGRTVLDGRVVELFKRFPELGAAKVIVRNESAVLEKWGKINQVEIVDGHALGQVVGDDVDLRLFLRSWKTAILVEEDVPSGKRTSIQIFDRHGDAVIKVYGEDEASNATLVAIAAAHRGSGGAVSVEPFVRPTKKPRPSEATVSAFQKAWDGMKDTHDFFLLLRDHGIDRVTALEVAGPDRAREVVTTACETVLEAASKSGEPIMIFVGNRGVLQIHTGPVKRVVRQAGYLNVLDPELNLHLRDQDIARAFVVRKPTVDGIVTSLELFDKDDETIALLFSKRKPGQTEQGWWRELCATFPGRSA